MRNCGAAHREFPRGRKVPASWACRRRSTRCPLAHRARWKFRRSWPGSRFRGARRPHTEHISRAPLRRYENCSRCTWSGRRAPECKRPSSFARRDNIKVVRFRLLHGSAVLDRFAMRAHVFDADVFVVEPQAEGAGLRYLYREFQNFAAVQDGGSRVVAGSTAQYLFAPFFAFAGLHGECRRGAPAARDYDYAASPQAESKPLLAVVADAHRERCADDLLVAHDGNGNVILRGGSVAGLGGNQEH